MRPKFFQGVSTDAVGGDGLQTLFYGDSNIQQYAPRIAALLIKNKGSQRGALFMTTEGGFPAGTVYRDDTGGKTDTAGFLRLAESRLVDRVVIGAAWGGYFSTDKYAFGVSTKASYHFGSLSLEQPGGADAVFDELEKMVALLISKGKRVTLILGIPSGNEFGKGQDALESREFFLIRGGFRFYQSVPRSTVESRLRFTNERLSGIATRTGAHLIQPLDALCPGGVCPTLGHKDAGHLRASYVRSSITYLDETVAD